jgi:hypothetical protein
MRVGTKSVLFGCDLNHIFAANRRSTFFNWCNGATTGRTRPLMRMCYELKIPLTFARDGS